MQIDKTQLLEKLEHYLFLTGRIFSACIFAMMAYIAAYIAIGTVQLNLREEVRTLAVALTFAIFCASLFYFFTLLAYRSITGKGRASDGALLPKPVMNFFLILYFGIMVIGTIYRIL